MQKKSGRHTPAFLLLFLSEGPAYGARLLSRMQTELPHCFADSADVYRSLQELEKNGLVEARWETRESGMPQKWYTITQKGRGELAAQAEDIQRRMDNFLFFMARYEAEETKQ